MFIHSILVCSPWPRPVDCGGHLAARTGNCTNAYMRMSILINTCGLNHGKILHKFEYSAQPDIQKCKCWPSAYLQVDVTWLSLPDKNGSAPAEEHDEKKDATAPSICLLALVLTLIRLYDLCIS